MPSEIKQEIKEQNKRFYEQLHKGMLVKGKVKNIQPYGAFIELQKGIVGLLHIEDISICRIKSPADMLKIGDIIVTKVKSYDKDTGRISLSYKDLLGTWEENVKGLEEKTIVKGIVRNREKFGVFIELKPNLVGLAEDKKLSVSYGDVVKVLVKKISPETKKIKLVILD
ncbi:MAG: S1 RNA-binding domain-containing protein [Clostridia bacterium]|nr:S1 RNA-binding domain-containing protein [Clostridia bacterium]